MNGAQARFGEAAYRQLQTWLETTMPDWSIGGIHGAISAAIACNHEQQYALLVEQGLLPNLREGIQATELPHEQAPLEAQPQDKQPINELLRQLYLTTSHQLTNTEFDYQLLLPPDEAPIKQRLAELIDFCDAFVLTFSTLNERQPLDQELTRLFNVMGQVQGADLSNKESLPSDETFETLSEYIRMGVVHLHSDRHTANQPS